MTEPLPYPAPRENPVLLGHEAAQRTLAEAVAQGRMHHAWLLAGPRGVGKATLAFRAARRLLAERDQGPALFDAPDMPADFAIPADDPVFRQVAVGSHPDLRVLERGVNEKTGDPRKEIPVEAVRDLTGFFGATAARGGWRVIIVDAADDLNRNAANALLKQLEEPSPRTVFFLISHVPGKLLPTIRSRCRMLKLERLEEVRVVDALAQMAADLKPDAQQAIAAMARGSIGVALDLAVHGGDGLYHDTAALFAALPEIDMQQVHKLGAALSGKRNAARFRCFRLIFERFLERGIRAAGADAALEQAGANGWAAQGSLDRWLALWDKARHLFERADAVNLDPLHVTLVLFEDLRLTASGGR